MVALQNLLRHYTVSLLLLRKMWSYSWRELIGIHASILCLRSTTFLSNYRRYKLIWHTLAVFSHTFLSCYNEVFESCMHVYHSQALLQLYLEFRHKQHSKLPQSSHETTIHFIETAPSVLREIPWLRSIEHEVITRRDTVKIVSAIYAIALLHCVIVIVMTQICGSHFVMDLAGNIQQRYCGCQLYWYWYVGHVLLLMFITHISRKKNSLSPKISSTYATKPWTFKPMMTLDAYNWCMGYQVCLKACLYFPQIPKTIVYVMCCHDKWNTCILILNGIYKLSIQSRVYP